MAETVPASAPRVVRQTVLSDTHRRLHGRPKGLVRSNVGLIGCTGLLHERGCRRAGMVTGHCSAGSWLRGGPHHGLDGR